MGSTVNEGQGAAAVDTDGQGREGSQVPTADERLRSIYENGLCANWLEECGESDVDYEGFLELIDEQVEMDRWERAQV